MSSPQFDVNLFEGMISDRGRLFRWERGRDCPCFNTRTHSPDRNCQRCGGLGVTYTLQVNPDREDGLFVATILGITASKKFAKFGEWESGDCMMTFPASITLGRGDRITLTTAISRETDVLIRGSRDRLIEPDIVAMVEVGDTNRLYTEGVDFQVTNGELIWVGQQPAAGVPYSVIYTARPAYVVYLDLPQVRAQVPGLAPDGAGTLREMPRKCALRRWQDVKRPRNQG